MKLTKCANGHFYDEEKFGRCPHCAGESKLDVNAIFGGTPKAPKPAMTKVESDDDVTVPLDWTSAKTSVASEEEKAEPIAVKPVEAPMEEPEIDIPSQPSFDTPLDFDTDFTSASTEKKMDEKTDAAGDALHEPEPEFELLSKFGPGEEAEKAERASVEAEVVAPEPAWKVPQPNVEEISSGEQSGVATPVDPELEDKPTEIVDEVEVELVNGLLSDGEDDDEHTVAFYDEIFTAASKTATETPSAVADEPVANKPVEGGSAMGAPVVNGSTGSEPVVHQPTEPNVFTAPPLSKVQTLPTPCVGWLIALNGSHAGQDFHLRVGKNYIGRDESMDVALIGDKSVSRNKHAIVVYEPRHHKYYIQPGESNELIYVNDEVVLLPMELKAYDLIVIGDVELWFMPLCDEKHNWSEVIRKLQEQMQQ